MSAAEAIAPEQSVDEVRQSLSVTDKGKTANTIDNCRIVFCCDPLLRDAIRLNLLTDRVDIVQDLGWRRNTSALTDTDVKYLLLYFEKNYELTSEKKITAALSIVANEHCYHPIQDVLNSLVWDGTPRIRSCLHHFLGADESDYVEEMLKHCALPGFVDSKNEEKTERNAGYLVVSHSGGGMLRQGTRKGIRRTPANRGMRAHWVVKGLDISEDVCHGMCP